MQKNKRIFWIILFGAITTTAVFLGIWLIYYYSVEQANQQVRYNKCVENIELGFNGKISSVDRYEYSEFMNKNFFGIKIQTNDSLNDELTYQFNINYHKALLEFASSGQSIKKQKGKRTFTISENGLTRQFPVPYCEEE